MAKEKILVLMGGWSEEREVSLRSGAAVLKALQNLGYKAQGMDLKEIAVQQIVDYHPDLVYLALHGKDGEDGTVQGMLEIMGLRYTGSGVAASAIGINKVLTKKIVSFEGIPTSPFTIIKRTDFVATESRIKDLVEKIGIPLVIKAATQGSSIGTYIVKDASSVPKAIEAAFEYDPEVLVEKFIDGTEVTSAVVGNENPEVLPLIEITSENEFYDFESKYTPGMCAHIIPARVEQSVQERIAELSRVIYKTLNCRGCARIDFIIDRSGQPFMLEVNTIPGMTEMSLVPDAARAAGMSFEQIVDKIVKLGLEQPIRKRD
ncbi:MAG: D-alanine--D-alanine ligase [Syntrophomonadaceae bacterium]|nr:D-alanine--D-alanine ligase [Syntrophomonadaceae bacterium]